MNWDEIIANTRIERVDEIIKLRVTEGILEDDLGPGKSSGIRHAPLGEILLEEAQEYVPDAKLGDEITLPPLWHFYFPYVDGLPTMTGEHGKTVEEATKRVIASLKE